MAKYKVGDIVTGKYTGRTGVIEDVEDTVAYPYYVKWENDGSKSWENDGGIGLDTNVGTTVTRASILDEAKKCVCGDRDNQYGSPEDNFATIGRFWTEYLQDNCVPPGIEVLMSAADVAAMMMLFKIARIKTGTGGKDSWVDAAGYAACGGEIANN